MISFVRRALLVGSVAALAGCDTMKRIGSGGASTLTLSGREEVPPVNTSGTGTGRISVASDGSVSGSVTTTGVKGTAAHIHIGRAGQNGPVIVPLNKSGDTYTVPSGSKLTPAQLEAYREGNLYVNVHSAAHPNGEVRAQLKP